MQHRPRRIRALIAATLALATTLGSFWAADAVTDALGTPMAIMAPTEADGGLQRAARLGAATDEQPAPELPTTSISTDVQTILDLTNDHRAAHGIAPLTLHPQLTEAAEIHATDHESRECVGGLSHTGSDGSNPGDRIASTGLRVRDWGENIACGHPTAARVVQRWIESPGHLANILNPDFTHLGVATGFGRDGYTYWGQVFGTPR